MPAVVESVAVGDSEGQSQSRLQSVGATRGGGGGCCLSGLRSNNPSREAERSARWVLKITQCDMVKRRGYGQYRNVSQPVLSPPVRLSVSHNTEVVTSYKRIKRHIYTFLKRSVVLLYSLCYIAMIWRREMNIECSYIYTKNIGISKHEKHLRLLSSGTKLFITFEFKGSST